MNLNIKKTSHIADVFAIPFFALLFVYFYNIENKSIIEYTLMLFSLCGFVFDSLFTCFFFLST